MIKGLPWVLVVDDQYGWDSSLRQSFVENSGLSDVEGQQASIDRRVALAVFSPGQRKNIDNSLVINDYKVIKRAVEKGPPDGGQWALVLLDVRFDSGRILADGLVSGDGLDDDCFGEEVRVQLAADFPDLPVVMLSAKRQAELSDHKIPYLSKRGITPYELRKCLLEYGRLSPEQQRFLLSLPPEVVAESRAGLELFREAFIVAGSDLPVLLLGETGTGKDVLAGYIHQCSRRAAGPFVAVNMAAIPEGLVESELFGHEKGAFTSADRKRDGLFKKAHGGTLFLDEIGDMPLALQAKVLRVLESRQVTPVGSARTVRVDVRIIAATSKDLATMQEKGAFREDLMRRISGATLKLPALRQRREDIFPMARAFLEQFARKYNKEGLVLEDDVRSLLEAHPFQGNVGELKHIILWLVNRKGNHSIISAIDVARALEHSFISAAPKRDQIQTRASALTGSLEELFQLMASWQVTADDPALKGAKPCLEKAVSMLLAKMAGAALERFRDPRNGKLNRQAAMQWLTGDDSLKGKGPGRVINEILGRKLDSPVKEEDLQRLVETYLDGMKQHLGETGK